MLNLNVNVAIKSALTALKQQYTGDGIKCVWLAGGTLIDVNSTVNILESPAERTNCWDVSAFHRNSLTQPISSLIIHRRECTRIYTHMNTHTAAKLPIITQDLCLKIHKSPKFYNSTGGGLQLCLDDYVLIIFVTCLRH